MKTKAEFKNRWRLRFKRYLAVWAGVLSLSLAAANGAAQTYSVVHSFGDVGMGCNPSAPVLVAPDGTLYGTTYRGGSSNLGTLFRVNADGSDFVVLKNFTGDDGAGPMGNLVLSGTTLYGTTVLGGSDNWGTIFRVETDGSGFVVMKHFPANATNGLNPNAGLALSGATLYGTSYFGGGNGPHGGDGVIFKVNTDGSSFTTLKKLFWITDGALPVSGLVMSGTTMYGTTSQGGSGDYGTVFKMNTDGSNYTVLKAFDGSLGANPRGTLVLAGTTLYGTMDQGGGAVFRIDADGSNYAVLKAFGGNGGTNYIAGLLWSGSTLFGTTMYLGSSNRGTVFQLNADGTGFGVLKEFAGSDGANPSPSASAGLVKSGNTLYGTTYSGGASNLGVVFGLSLPPPVITKSPASQTVEQGTTISFTSVASSIVRPLFQWFFNGSNAITLGTNSFLRLTNVQFANIGSYTVVATNTFGAVTSAPAMLHVIPAVERRPVPGVKVTGETASLLNVDYANSLSPAPNWITLGSVSLTSTSQFCPDLTMPLPPERFYRAWQTGTPSVVPSLNLNIVPAITLTGNVGDSLRLDCINAIGPTNDWVTLDTVTLTNTSQLYFDVSAPGQPARLWRIVPAP